MVSAKFLCCDITCKSIPGSPPLFLFFVGVRGEPRNEDTQIVAVNGHPAIDLTQYLLLNVKRKVDEICMLRHHFEWQGRPWSMELKYSKALCELATSTRHASKLIHFGKR